MPSSPYDLKRSLILPSASNGGRVRSNTSQHSADQAQQLGNAMAWFGWWNGGHGRSPVQSRWTVEASAGVCAPVGAALLIIGWSQNWSRNSGYGRPRRTTSTVDLPGFTAQAGTGGHGWRRAATSAFGWIVPPVSAPRIRPLDRRAKHIDWLVISELPWIPWQVS